MMITHVLDRGHTTYRGGSVGVGIISHQTSEPRVQIEADTTYRRVQASKHKYNYTYFSYYLSLKEQNGDTMN